jgi:hypothetical protein
MGNRHLCPIASRSHCAITMRTCIHQSRHQWCRADPAQGRRDWPSSGGCRGAPATDRTSCLVAEPTEDNHCSLHAIRHLRTVGVRAAMRRDDYPEQMDCLTEDSTRNEARANSEPQRHPRSATVESKSDARRDLGTSNSLYCFIKRTITQPGSGTRTGTSPMTLSKT